MEEKQITISKYEYDNLKETKLKYEIIMNFIFYNDSTELTYDKKDLSINSNRVIKIVKAVDPLWYQQVLSIYKGKEENNNDTN